MKERSNVRKNKTECRKVGKTKRKEKMNEGG